MSTPIRRVITGHDEDGTAVVTLDSPAPNARVRSASGLTSTLIWVEDHTPADNAGDTDKADRESGVSPPDNGSVFRVVEFPPEQEGHSFSNDAMKAEMGLEANDGTVIRHPGMHRTRSVDYAIVISGEIHMLLDDSEVHLAAGDTLVQRGTNHAWANRGTEPCRIAFVLIDAKPL